MAASFFLLYFDYLLGDKAFSFYDVGSDSFLQTYPSLVSQANRVADGIWKGYVNFKRGLGNREGALGLTAGNWFCIFGEDAVLKWMGINHYLKVLAAGILAYFWAKTYSENTETSFIVGFGYAMSTEFTVRSAWNSYPNTALFLALWLLTYELWHRKGKWYLLPIATRLFFYNNGIYNCLVWGFLLGLYIIFRELADRKSKLEWRKLLHMELLYVLFAVIGLVNTLIAQLQAIFSSARFTDAYAGFSSSTDSFFADKEIIFTAFLRTLGQSIMGISDDYIGSQNFLEGPAFYCGILLFLLIPVSLYNLNRKKRFYYILAVLAACLYIAVNPIRILANGFVKETTFKLSSYWICIFMFILSMEVLMRIFSGKELKKRSKLIFQYTAEAGIILFLVTVKLRYIARTDALAVSIVFILIYVIIMQLIHSGVKRKKTALRSLCVVFAVETIVLSWPVINDRDVVKMDDIYQKKYYNDYTVDAVELLAERDKGWYRLKKAYDSVSLCDSLVQNYYGSKSYIGGTEADPGIIAIYRALGLTRGDSSYHNLMGTGENVYAAALLGEKYYLSKNRATDEYGLQYLFDVGDVSVYENKLALPFVYTYGQAVSEYDFDRLSFFDRGRNVLGACVVDTQYAGIENINPSVFDFSGLSEYRQVYEQSDGLYQLDLYESRVLIVRLMMAADGYDRTIDFLNDTGITISSETISYDAGEKVIEISCDGLHAIRFPDEMCEDMESIEFYAVDAEQYYAELERNVTELQNHAMKITAHDEIYNYIEGTVSCEQPRMLATSIPISGNWKILVDGQAAEVITVNKGFVGCYLDEGDHNIVISYDGKGWLEANIFNIVGFIAALGVLVVGGYKIEGRAVGISISNKN